MKDVIDVAVTESSHAIGRIDIRCVIKTNHKIACRPHIKSQEEKPEAKSTLLIKDLPEELRY